MKQLLACLTLIGVLVQAGVVYPQAMKVYAVDEGESGNYTVTLRSSDGNLYGVDTDLNDMKLGEMVAVLMYDNMTAGNPLDDTVLAMHRTGFFETGGQDNGR